MFVSVFKYCFRLSTAVLFSVSIVFKYLFPPLIKSCACLPHPNFGFVIHGYLIKCGFGNWVGVGNSVIRLYVKFGHFWDAYRVFEEMPIKDEDLFNCLVSGFGSNGFYGEVLVLFEQIVYVLAIMCSWVPLSILKYMYNLL